MIRTAHLFHPMSHELLQLLRSLPPAGWDAPTSAKEWRVKDVVAHMLDIDYRRISVVRDGHLPPGPSFAIHGEEDLVRYLNALNGEWVTAARRMSPRLLCDCLEATSREIAMMMETADPHGEAVFPVSWVGDTRSVNWLDMGREYTERWHHQDQIREAVNASPLRAENWLRPVLEISVLALPHAYRAVPSADGSAVELRVTGAAAGVWHLARVAGAWQLQSGTAPKPSAVLHGADLDVARLLLHRLSADHIRTLIHVSGDSRLAAPLLSARAVMV
jgi:hypothetical protein